MIDENDRREYCKMKREIDPITEKNVRGNRESLFQRIIMLNVYLNFRRTRLM